MLKAHLCLGNGIKINIDDVVQCTVLQHAKVPNSVPMMTEWSIYMCYNYLVD